MLRRLATLAILSFLTLTAAAQQVQPVEQGNHLRNEKSRYLRDHSTDLVDWRPWGDAAFMEAKKGNRPIFLSIGYASCHWCHVMERESFANAEIAQMINAYFIPVLVDREEHPDVDATYIALLNAMTGSAGWPANLILTPDLQPVVGATYMKPDALSRMLVIVSNKWAEDRKGMLESSAQLVGMAKALGSASEPGDVDAKVLDAVTRDITSTFDQKFAGFGGAPKFPKPMTISYLLRGDANARSLALDTLRTMAKGAIHDQLGGGFHRYTTDAAWMQPHFEKMLSDQALLAIAYTEAWQITKEDVYRDVARDTIDYVLRDLRGPKGAAFDSGQDADSLVPGQGAELREGAFYYWTREQVRYAVGEEKAPLMIRLYNIGSEPTLLALNDPQLIKDHPDEIAALKARMLDIRQKRPQPFRDDKNLTAWNSLMMSALARAGAAFDDREYIAAAANCANFLTTKLWNANTRTLYRRYAQGSAGVTALPEDYAFLIQGLLDTFEATYDVKWLDLAVTLQKRQDELFWDAKTNRYSGRLNVPPQLRTIAIEADDAVPSASSVAALNLLRMAELTDQPAWHARAQAIFRSFASELATRGADYPQLASAARFAFSTPKQIVIAGDPRKDDTRALLRLVQERFVPNRVLVLAQPKITRYLPFVAEMKPLGEKATAYVCEHSVCKLPTSDPGTLIKLLE